MPHTTIATPLSRANPGLPPELARITRQPNHIMSHATAAMLWDIHQPRSECPTGQHRMLHGTSTHRHHSESGFDLPHVTVTAEARLPRISAACCHRLNLSPPDITELAGLRLTTPERTWFDLLPTRVNKPAGHRWPPLVYPRTPQWDSRTVPLAAEETAIVWAELLLHRRMISLSSLKLLVDRTNGSVGATLARKSLGQIVRGPRRPEESFLRLRLLAAGLKPKRDVVVLCQRSVKRFRFPLAFPAARVAVVFQTCECPPAQPEGWTVAGITSEHLAKRNGLAQEVERAFYTSVAQERAYGLRS